jgi:hypothetical protein
MSISTDLLRQMFFAKFSQQNVKFAMCGNYINRYKRSL